MLEQNDLLAYARKLHQRFCVVDSLSYTWGPFRAMDLPEALENELARLSQSGEPIEEKIDGRILAYLVADQEFRKAYEEAWQEAAVDGISVTVGSVAENSAFALKSLIKDVALWNRLFDMFPFLQRAVRARSVEEAKSSGRRAVIFNTQNSSFLGGSLDPLELVYNLGVRIVQLTYNSMNLVGTGCTERVDAGLSHFGRQVVRELNKLNVLIDLSHCSRQTIFDTLVITTAPVALTHVSCNAVCPHARAKSDEEIKAVAESGGYIGILCVPAFVSSESRKSLRHVVDHIDHVVDLVGVNHVGIGTDWGARYPKVVAQKLNEESLAFGFRQEHKLDWCETLEGFRSWLDWPNITAELIRRGYTEEEVGKIIGGNFLRLLKNVLGG